MKRIRIWDWPTRLTHWLLVALVLFSWGSAEYHQMELHRYSGYAVLGLIAFRVYWGVFGSVTARFKEFVKGPRAVLSYFYPPAPSSTRAELGEVQSSVSSIGHNPLGALSVIALLSLLIAQVTLGLFAVDIDGLESGPLSHLVSFDTGRACAEAHEIVFNVLLGFIVLHVAAVLFYLVVKRNNLIAPMLTGKKAVPMEVVDPNVRAPWGRVVGGIVFAAAIVFLIV